MMKILFISAFPPARANLAEYAEYFINDLRKHKEIEKIIILANKTENAKKHEKIDKIEVIRCWETNSLTIPFQLIKNAFMQRHSYDLIHFYLNMRNWGTGRLVNFFGYTTPLLLKLIFRKKVILTLHNVADAVRLDKVNFIPPSFFNKLGLKIATKFLLKSDTVTVTIKYYKKILEKKYGAKNVICIPLGFPTTINKIYVENKKKTILLFGFLDPRKNLPTLIKIFKELKSKDKKVKLVIAGISHPQFPNYLDKIKNKFNDPDIVYTGYVPQEKVKDLFLSSTLVVLPYTVGVGSSAVLHLAASYGKPVVATNLEDLARVIKDEGLLVETSNLKNLKKSMEKVLYNKKLQRKIISHNLKAAKKMSFKVITKKFVNLYERQNNRFHRLVQT